MPQENSDFSADLDVYGYGASVSNFNGVQPRNRQTMDVVSDAPQGVMVSVGTQSVPVLGVEPTRRNVTFINPGDQTIYLIPSNLDAIVGQGVPLPAGERIDFVSADLVNWTCGWNAIAASGSNNPLTILVV